MVRQNGISATKPIFPSYLLPSLKIPFTRRRSSSASSRSSAPSSVDQPSADTTPSNSPPRKAALDRRPDRLSKVAPDTLRCLSCSSDVAFASQIISKGFTGRHGRAFLVAPATRAASPTAAADGDEEPERTLLNIRVGRSENRQLVTGWHVVADISCNTCSTKLGWKYVDAKEEAQKYKIGKFILETERVVTFSTWEDRDALERDDGDDGGGDTAGWDAAQEDGGSYRGRSSEGDEVAFDSEDEDECDDIFAGTWDAETVARRRSRMVAQVKPAEV